MKLRTIITQDAEVDDQNSLRHFLLYANEVELQGIVQTSSVFHWQGKEGVVGPKQRMNEFFQRMEEVAPYDQPYRWTGTQWMFREIDEYEQIYPNLIRHADGYPDPEYLRSIVKVGNVGYSGDMSGKTEGSELIRQRILDDDPRTLYLQVWGGTNTICQALKDIEEEYKEQDGWNALKEKISKKCVITACGEQDCTYREYLAENWPKMKFIVVLQMQSYAYPWMFMPECDSKDTLRAAYMKNHILLEENPLTRNYCTWMDGKTYEGEGWEGQFGTNPELVNMMRSIKKDLPPYEQYDFISEGDSPTFFWMFDWGFRTEESFAYGGFSGRYYLDETEKNSKGEQLNYWKVAEDEFTGRDGVTAPQESMWRYVRDIQHDMAARAKWGITPEYKDGEHAPELLIEEGVDLTVSPAETVELHAKAKNPDGGAVKVTWRIYTDASIGDSAKETVPNVAEDGLTASITIPENAKPGETIHVIVCAEGDGEEKLRHYRQVILTI